VESKQASIPTALTVAGSDSSGGAGIQADLKTFHRFGVYGTSAVTLVTAQNTHGVRHIHVFPASWVAEQIAAIVDDLELHAAKTGALGTVELVETVAEAVARHAIRPLVVDPVLASQHGTPLLPAAGVEVLRKRLLPQATLVTPNLSEATALSGVPIQDERDMREAARIIRATGAAAVLVKGGHLPGDEAVDLLFDGREFLRFPAPKQRGPSVHGTGCAHSAAIAARLALGDDLPCAVRAAKEFMTQALLTAATLGGGSSPVGHWG
jgi:hydroxymethylpyrimidine/phosphomethylpyrimidine kinase